MPEKNCFVIMPFSDRESPEDNRWEDLYENVIQPAVEGAELGYTCYRSLNPPGSFMHDVVRHLATDDVAIAVLTELRPNVMYELGARNALKGRTIMLVEQGMTIPSDLSAYIALFYSTRTQESRDALTRTIRARLARLDGEMPTSDNPIFDNLALFSMALVSEWSESQNREAFRARLERILSHYVLSLEHVWRKVGRLARTQEPPEMVHSPLLDTKDEAARHTAMMWINRGTELKDAHEFEQALRHFEVALQIEPGNLQALGNKSLVLTILKRYDEAEESVRSITSRHPATADEWNAMGKGLIARRQFSRAAEAFRRAAALDPASAVYANSAGFALEQSGDDEGALQHYEAALRANPDFPQALYNKGKVLKKLGREREGTALIQQALVIDPLIASISIRPESPA